MAIGKHLTGEHLHAINSNLYNLDDKANSKYYRYKLNYLTSLFKWQINEHRWPPPSFVSTLVWFNDRIWQISYYYFMTIHVCVQTPRMPLEHGGILYYFNINLICLYVSTTKGAWTMCSSVLFKPMATWDRFELVYIRVKSIHWAHAYKQLVFICLSKYPPPRRNNCNSINQYLMSPIWIIDVNP